MPSATDLPRVRDDQLPKLSVPPTEIIAVEHPMIVRNLDNALKTFGRGHPFKQMMDPACAQDILPLYLRPNDPTCAVLKSTITPTSNVVLKITAPKRTGRKRKRGSQGPFLEEGNSEPPVRLDANAVFRSLKDNPTRYQVEPLGVVNLTHRYRGMADFHKSTISSPFMTRVQQQLLSGDLDTFKTFKLHPDRGFKLNEDVIPPPLFAESNLPYQWAYNWTGFENAASTKTKTTQSRIKGHFSYDLSLPIPTVHPRKPDEKIIKVVEQLRECFELRPIWTRRALEDYFGSHKIRGEIKEALPYVSYQFHGGPWRDACIKLGVDPRTDPESRIYQTFIFKIKRLDNPETLKYNWVLADFGDNTIDRRKWESHKFDGTGFSLNGRIWQVCDITDPLLSKIFATQTIRDTPDLKQEGWFCNGTYAKVRAIMRTKLRALQTGRILTEEDFEEALKIPDNVVGDTAKWISVPVPDVGITEKLGDQEWNRTKKKKNARDAITFKMNTSHGARRGKRVGVEELQDAIAGDGMDFEMDQSLRPSIETGGDEEFTGNEMELVDFDDDDDDIDDDDDDDDEEDDEDEDEDDVDEEDDDDDSHDHSSVDSGSYN